MKNILLLLLMTALFISCAEKKTEYASFDEYPSPMDSHLWLEYNPEYTVFKLWSPIADKVQVHLYERGDGGEALESHLMESNEEAVWSIKLKGDLNGSYYTFQVQTDGKWLEETAGSYAKAVGVNGQRAMVLDLVSTNPEGWDMDKGPKIKYINEAIIYELHIRDMSIHPASGSSRPGGYLGLVEEGTLGPHGVATGMDHLKEMGITHVHLLPTFDFPLIDETKMDIPQFNWGYMPLHYNIPEGYYSSNPYQAEVRIQEFKQMVKAFHDHGIGVILDVVYNHTGYNENSCFNLEVPGYYYRHWEDGSPSDAAACGNETASDKPMMRKYIKESVAHWAQEYHIDGFRFDLMGIHDIKTMNEVIGSLKEINPNIFVYGEGWTAGDSPLQVEDRALKHHIPQMPHVSAFSDDIRDGIKGSVFDDQSTGFVSGAENTEESIKFGIVGSIQHPQIDYSAVNYSDAPWALEPWQSVSYVSCHDNHTLYDKLKVSRTDASEQEIIAMDKLAQGIIMTSQGTAFMHAGAEMLRTKNGEHNSYNLPDSINQIDWNWKVEHAEVVEYYKNLIALRKQHPAFRMTHADELREKLEFKKTEKGLLSYQISHHANGDQWKNIYVIYNARPSSVDYQLQGEWHLAMRGDDFYLDQSETIKNHLKIPALSMVVLFQK